MEIFGHVLTFYAALRRAGVETAEAEALVEEHAAKLCFTDAIRCTVKGDDVVRFGRGYSHFTDGCSMVLPYGENLKNFTDIHQTSFETGNGYRSKFADEPTDFAKFIETNPALFTPENADWGIAALSHLHQDVNSDMVWQHELCKCNTTMNEVVYPLTGAVVNGETFRKDMALVNIYMHRVFVELVSVLFEDSISDDFLQHARNSFWRWYSPAMAENTCKYLNMDSRIFTTPSKELFAELGIANTKICNNCDELEDFALSLFSDAVASCNALINRVAR